MLLWTLFAALTAIVALIIVRPYWRQSAPAGPFAHDVAVYKQQLAELEDEAARGLLGPAEAESGRIEISRRILAASEGGTTGPVIQDASSRAPYVIVALLATMSMGIYLLYGSPQLSDQPLSARISPDKAPPIEALIARVEERLRSNPEDGAGWAVIAPVYVRLGRYTDAAEAFKKAIAILGETPDRLGELGEALTFANEGAVTDEARGVFEKALSADGANLRARFWLAVAEEQAGRLGEAATRYKALLAAGLPENVDSVVKERLAAIEGKPGETAAPSADQQAMIDGMVSGLAERLKKDGSDLEGWLKLMRAYTVLGRRDDALGALKQAQSQFAGNQDALGQIEQLARSLGLTS